jgi:ubiquinone/menaquinone biosynthesis C-methylase UbiE
MWFFRPETVTGELRPRDAIRKGEIKMTTTTMQKPHGDRPITGMMAKWYASNTAEMMKDYVELARRIAGELPERSRMLEVAPGPGYFSIELAKLGSYEITGLDLSDAMVKIARKHAAEAGVRAEFMQGSASKMPLQTSSYDFLLCRAAFKNFAQPVEALREMCRVLRPGGRGLIIDLKRESSSKEVAAYVDSMNLSAMNKIVTKFVFRTMLLRSAYTRAQFEAMLTQANFTRFEIAESGIGFEISMTK